MGTLLSRRLNLVASIAWLAIIPIALFLGWFESVAFIAAASIYANFASHVAAWRADSPTKPDG